MPNLVYLFIPRWEGLHRSRLALFVLHHPPRQNQKAEGHARTDGIDIEACHACPKAKEIRKHKPDAVPDDRGAYIPTTLEAVGVSATMYMLDKRQPVVCSRRWCVVQILPSENGDFAILRSLPCFYGVPMRIAETGARSRIVVGLNTN